MPYWMIRIASLRRKHASKSTGTMYTRMMGRRIKNAIRFSHFQVISFNLSLTFHTPGKKYKDTKNMLANQLLLPAFSLFKCVFFALYLRFLFHLILIICIR